MGHSPSNLKSGHESPLIREFEPGTHCREARDSISPINRRATPPRISTSQSARVGSRASASRATTHRRTRSAVVPGRHSGSSQPRNPPPPYSAAVETAPIVIPSNNERSLPPNPPVARETATDSNSTASRAARIGLENALETLRKYNTVFIVDDSRSMYGNLWKEARDALAKLAEQAQKYDTDGIDVYFFNNNSVGYNLSSSNAVKHLFDRVTPKGITPMGEKLEELLLDYLLSLETAKDIADSIGDQSVLKSIKPVNYIVLTDGAPTDDPESVIVAAARRLDARHFPVSQVGIQFVQIGNSPQAAEFLAELDDGLAAIHGIRDIVDTTPYTGSQLTAEILTKILLGGINRRVDRRGGNSVLSQ